MSLDVRLDMVIDWVNVLNVALTPAAMLPIFKLWVNVLEINDNLETICDTFKARLTILS